MHTLELNGRKVAIVPLHAETIFSEVIDAGRKLRQRRYLFMPEYDFIKDLPEGSWRLHSTWPEITETEAADVVHREPINFRSGTADVWGFKNYSGSDGQYIKASLSFCSLLESLFLPLTARYAILVDSLPSYHNS